MKDANTFFRWLSKTALLLCLLTVTISAMDRDTLKGRVFDSKGIPVAGVEIFLFDSGLQINDDKTGKLSSYALEQTRTGSSGEYTLQLPSVKSGTLMGKKRNQWFRRIVLPGTPQRVFDTLKACGNLYFYLHLEKIHQHDNVSVSLMGTPFSAKSDKNGAVMFNCIAPGSYKAILDAGRPAYLDVLCTLRIVTSAIDTFPDTLIIPLAKTGTHKNVAIMVSDSVIEQSVSMKKKVTDTPVNSSKDSSAHTQDTVIRRVEKPVVNAGNDTTVGIRDDVILQGSAHVLDGVITKWEWAIGGSPFTTHPGGTVTVQAPATTKQQLICVLRVTADNGLQAYDSVIVHAFSSPPVAQAKGDSIIGLFDTIVLTGSATDNGKVVSMGWDIGNKGTFSNSQNGSIIHPPHRLPQDSLWCIFRAIDDDGETGFDTLYIKVRVAWKKVMPEQQIPERKGHSLVNFNGSLWIIGGNKSDIWSSADGTNWQKVSDAAPFGERFGHSATAFNGQLYVIGGKGPDDSYTNDIWSSFDGKSWRKINESDFLRRHYHTVTEFNNRLWLIGGLGESGYEACLNDIWSTDDGIQWKMEKDTAQFSRRYGHGAVVHNNSFIIAGGLYEGFHGTKTLQDLWQSSDGITWTCVLDSTPVSEATFLSYIEYDNRIWSIGSFCKECPDSLKFLHIQYTTQGNGWIPILKVPQPGSRLFSASSVFNNRLFISPSDTPFLLIFQ